MGPDQDNQNNNPNPAPGGSVPPDGGGDSTPPESGDTGQPTVSGGGAPDSNKKKMWILIVLLILLALLAGLWFWMSSSDKEEEDTTTNTTQQEETETATCAEGFTEYTNEDLGIAFCYPTEWGAPTVADAKFAAADTGERWRVTFADKAAVNLGLVTEDWTTEVARDGTCVDPATQTLPAFSPFSTEWVTEGSPVTNASRGIEVQEGEFLLNEDVDNLLGNGVCIHGYTIIDGETFTHTAASYSAEFSETVTSPQQHVDSPNTLVSEADREAYYTFVKSVRSL